MKNKAALFLIAIAIPLYFWDSHVLLSGLFAHKKPASYHEAAFNAKQEFAFSAPMAPFEIKGRSPFIASKEKPKPIGAAQGSEKKSGVPKPAVTVSPPKITVTGIMWHPTNPLAMITLPDGSSTTVKAGQTIGNFKFKTIEKNRVLVVVDKSEFWIAK